MILAFFAGASLASMGFVKAALAIAEKRRQRRALSKLDDRLLMDIGLTRSEAAREARRLF